MNYRTSILIAVTAVVTGCATSQPPVAVEAATPVVTLAAPAPEVRTPEVVRAYTVGAYIDPGDPRVRHDAHVIHRVEAAPAWNLQPSLGIEAVPDAAERRVLADQQAQIRRQHRQTLALDSQAGELAGKLEQAGHSTATLAAENQRLRSELEAARNRAADAEMAAQWAAAAAN